MKQLSENRKGLKHPKEFLVMFASRFVNESFKERFVHEALKKPIKLHSRVCHTIEDIFMPAYRSGKCPFQDEDICVVISGTDQNLQESTWSELKIYSKRGAGLLIANRTGDQFYAETESEFGSPFETYSSSGT